MGGGEWKEGKERDRDEEKDKKRKLEKYQMG